MPIVAWWPNLIVIFEMTMLGAILATVITLIVTAGLGRRMPTLYDPEVTNGKILVGDRRRRATNQDAPTSSARCSRLPAPTAQDHLTSLA